MKFSLIPRYAFRDFSDISPDFLRKLGVRFLMLDLDNTIASYREHSPAGSIKKWVADMRANGIELYFVSNSTRRIRVDTFAQALDIRFIKGARKPSTKGLLQAMEQAGFSANMSAFLGDQIFTDTLAANLASVTSIIVKPRSIKNPFFFLRYIAEAPFRAVCLRRMTNSGVLKRCVNE